MSQRSADGSSTRYDLGNFILRYRWRRQKMDAPNSVPFPDPVTSFGRFRCKTNDCRVCVHVKSHNHAEFRRPARAFRGSARTHRTRNRARPSRCNRRRIQHFRALFRRSRDAAAVFVFLRNPDAFFTSSVVINFFHNRTRAEGARWFWWYKLLSKRNSTCVPRDAASAWSFVMTDRPAWTPRECGIGLLLANTYDDIKPL
jgi:hypothetical protein